MTTTARPGSRKHTAVRIHSRLLFWPFLLLKVCGALGDLEKQAAQHTGRKAEGRAQGSNGLRGAMRGATASSHASVQLAFDISISQEELEIRPAGPQDLDLGWRAVPVPVAQQAARHLEVPDPVPPPRTQRRPRAHLRREGQRLLRRRATARRWR